MPRQVFLHIGAPKTGTTYLQDRLAANVKSLAEHGVHFPGGTVSTAPSLAQFRAALDLLEQDWGGPAGHADGAWEALMKKVRRLDGVVVISHEILGAAAPHHIERARRDLSDSELHIVYSTRDLGRMIPAAWQESVKQGSATTYRRFLRRIRRGHPFWSLSFDLPQVLSTWGEGLDPSHIHVVTAPSSRSGDVLWERFCTVFGIEPGWAPQQSTRTNPSLGAVETEVLRKLYRRIDRSLRRDHSVVSLVSGMLAEGALVHRRSAPLQLPPRAHPWVSERAAVAVEYLRSSGVDVVGDLADLDVGEAVPPEEYRDPSKISSKEQLAVALDALATMTHEAARRPDPNARLTAKVRRRFGGS